MTQSDYLKVEGNQLLIDECLIPRGEQEKLSIEQIIDRRQDKRQVINTNQRLVICGLADN